jgi:hypothetical protein
MSQTTDTVRSQGFMVLECDIPSGMTLDAWRARRSKRHGRLHRHRRRARRAPSGC